MIQYSSTEEAKAALMELEENEQTGSINEKVNSDKHFDNEKPTSRSTFNASAANGKNNGNGNEENGGIHEDNGGSDTDSGSGTIEQEGDEEELEEDNHDDAGDTDQDDDDDDDGPASDEDDEVHVRPKVAKVNS